MTKKERVAAIREEIEALEEELGIIKVPAWAKRLRPTQDTPEVSTNNNDLYHKYGVKDKIKALRREVQELEREDQAPLTSQGS